MAYGIKVSIGDWDGKMNLMVVFLNDFDMILSNDFFVSTKVAIMPYLFWLLINNEKKPCFMEGHGMPAKLDDNKHNMVSTMRLDTSE